MVTHAISNSPSSARHLHNLADLVSDFARGLTSPTYKPLLPTLREVAATFGQLDDIVEEERSKRIFHDLVAKGGIGLVAKHLPLFAPLGDDELLTLLDNGQHQAVHKGMTHFQDLTDRTAERLMESELHSLVFENLPQFTNLSIKTLENLARWAFFPNQDMKAIFENAHVFAVTSSELLRGALEGVNERHHFQSFLDKMPSDFLFSFSNLSYQDARFLKGIFGARKLYEENMQIFAEKEIPAIKCMLFTSNSSLLRNLIELDRWDLIEYESSCEELPLMALAIQLHNGELSEWPSGQTLGLQSALVEAGFSEACLRLHGFDAETIEKLDASGRYLAAMKCISPNYSKPRRPYHKVV